MEQCTASASPNTITVQDPRPVDKAIQELEKRYGWRITYEDPPYSHNNDITDVTYTSWPGVPIQSPSQLQAAQQEHRRLGPKGGSLSFTLPSADPDEFGAVEALVKSYNASHGGNVFAVVQGAGLLHVVPQQMTGLSGNLEPVKPVLDTVITIEPKERTAYELNRRGLQETLHRYEHKSSHGNCPNKYVIPDEDFHRRIGKDGAIDFRTIDSRTIDSRDWRPVVVVMAAIVRPRCKMVCSKY